GLANRKSDAKALARGRTRLLDWLADRGTGHTLLVVFDGGGNSRSSGESLHRGVRVRFSFQQTADELIEDLLRSERRPAKLTVISNDRQVQDAGRSRGCVVLGCEAFVDALLAEPKAAPPPADDKPPPRIDDDDLLAAFSQPKPRPKK
ncbi:MAG: NYN domain-containing protein, partial [Gemmataceae bacterium]